MEKIKSFSSKQNLKIPHYDINNYGKLDKKGIPSVILEMTLINPKKFKIENFTKQKEIIPITGLDYKNQKEEMILKLFLIKNN